MTARELMRTIVRTPSAVAPALRGGAMSIGGTAPALRGGAMSIGGTAPALRGGAMSMLALGALAFALAGCEREVTVADAGAPRFGVDPAAMMPAQAGGAAHDVGSPASGSAGAPTSGNDAGAAAEAPSAMALGDAGEAGSAASTSVMDGIDQLGTGAASRIADVQILAVFLSAIELPAVGTSGVSLAQYFGANQAATLYADWNGGLEFWHVMSRAYYIYTAASLDRHIGLLYAMGSYGIHEGDDAAEISGTPTTYKEFLSANPTGYAWVDYKVHAGGSRPVPAAGGAPAGGGEQTLGEIVFRTWSGESRSLTDALRYRARLDLSDTHVAFVEYADTAPGTVGQIVVQPIDGGEPIVAAPSGNHQDRPAIDHDWVVWEEYLDESDAVIRARNLTTGEVRDLSSARGFRTNPDILGTRVVWEDQRSGNGDIYFTDLGDEEGERVAVSGPGHSAATRLSSDGLVWIESADDNIALLRARWLE